jgi:endo-1,4-beta-xylanase
MRESYWYEIIGKDFLVKAFEYAREADPDAELYYNDYSLENPSKRQGAVELVQYLQENDAPITGIGTQGHFMLNSPSLENIEQTIVAFADLGIDVMITELDLMCCLLHLTIWELM